MSLNKRLQAEIKSYLSQPSKTHKSQIEWTLNATGTPCLNNRQSNSKMRCRGDDVWVAEMKPRRLTQSRVTQYQSSICWIVLVLPDFQSMVRWGLKQLWRRGAILRIISCDWPFLCLHFIGLVHGLLKYSTSIWGIAEWLTQIYTVLKNRPCYVTLMHT